MCTLTCQVVHIGRTDTTKTCIMEDVNLSNYQNDILPQNIEVKALQVKMKKVRRGFYWKIKMHTKEKEIRKLIWSGLKWKIKSNAMVAPVHYSPGAQVRTHGEEGNEWEEVHVQGQPHGMVYDGVPFGQKRQESYCGCKRWEVEVHVFVREIEVLWH